MAWRVDMTGLALFILCFISTFLGSAAIPLCTDSRAPLPPKTPLSFCSYNGSVCCDAKEDAALKKQFESMNVSDPACSSVVKSILCAKCDQFSGELFRINSQYTLPALCNGTVSKDSTQSTNATSDFCSNVWKKCQNVPIMNSPFATSLKGGPTVNASSTKLTDFWQSEKDFCVAFGGSSGDQQVCFAGSQVTLDSVVDSPPKGLCIEKIGNGSYLNMAAHPDGSNRVFLSNQAGKIWLATIPKAGSGETIQLDESNPFLDITDIVHFDSEFGLMGIAFHPDFVNNGRFFVSYNCDKSKSAGCSGRCACNSAVDCDPSKLVSENGAMPCQFGSVVAEYSAKTGQQSPSEAKSANPLEVRRTFTMGLPYTSHHGGQVLFGPADKYLYFMMGDGGSRGDPNNFAQNKKSLLGKIMRLDVDKIPSATEISQQGLWGNYSVPKDNPFSEDNELEPEIWALGFRNPWRCSFDSKRPPYFLCADVGQEQYEEVDLVTKGGNYGWRVYEGPYLYDPLPGSLGNTSASTIQAIPPLMGYNHSSINKNEGSASIIGGYYYRSNTDPCMYGRYLYADLYASALWASIENPSGSGKFNNTMIPFNCAADSPISCTYTSGNPLPTVGIIYSFGEDNSKDIYLLTNNGVYRVVPPSRCNYTCSKEVVTPSSGNSAPSPSSSSAKGQFGFVKKAIILICVFLLAVLIS
ncbi:HIPL1 protein-like [Nymphaea colorata]|nr:HIPL1 protein-like [Nymphaea colorata]